MTCQPMFLCVAALPALFNNLINRTKRFQFVTSRWNRVRWPFFAVGGGVLLLLSAFVSPAPAQSVFLAGAQTAVPISGLDYAYAVAVDASGNVFVADRYGNQVIEIPVGGGSQITVCGPNVVTCNGLNQPTGVAVDGAGNVLIADPYMQPPQVVLVPVGCTGSASNCQSTVGSVISPYGVAVDGSNNVYVADSGGASVVKVLYSSNGTYGAQTTVCGSGVPLCSELSTPVSLAVDGTGDIFILDLSYEAVFELPYQNNEYGTETTLCGPGVPVCSGLTNPTALAVDGAGDVFIADPLDGRVVKLPYLDSSGTYGAQITVGAGLYYPTGVAVDGAGDVFIADNQNLYNASRILVVPNTPFVQTWFGPVNVCPLGQSCSPTKTITLSFIVASVVSQTTSFGANVVMQGTPSGDFNLSNEPGTCITGPIAAPGICTVNVTFAPTAPGLRSGAVQLTNLSSGNVVATALVYGEGQGPALAFGPGTPTTSGTGLTSPQSAAIDAAGDVFILDSGNNRVVKLPAGGGAQITLPASGLNLPTGLAVDGAGDVLISDYLNFGPVVEIPYLNGTYGAQRTVSQPFPGLRGSVGVAVDGGGDIFAAKTGEHEVWELLADDSIAVVAGGMTNPVSVALDGAGDVFVSDIGSNQVVKVPCVNGVLGGPCAAYAPPTSVDTGSYVLSQPNGVAVDVVGDIFIADTLNSRVVEVPADGSEPLVVNTGSYALSQPYGVAVDGAGDIFIADTGNNRVVELQRPPNPALSFGPTPVGSVSSPLSITIQNIGNQPLNAVAPGLLVAGPNFVQVAGSGTLPDCSSSFALPSGASCNLSISFAPQSVGNLTSAATFTDNALNAVPFAIQSVALQGTGTKASTVTVLTSTPNPSAYGQSVTFTATVIPQGGGQTNGTVTFYNGSTVLGSSTVTNNVASFATAALPIGTDSITAVYSGSSDFTGSTSGVLSQVVQKPATDTSLSSSPNPSVQGKSVTFTATVSAQLGGATPTGSITFLNGSTPLSTVTLINGVATFKTSALAPGSDSITAVYGGSTTYGGSTAVLDQIVTATTTTTVASSPNPSAYGQAVTFTATVTSSGGVTPSGGTVSFLQGTTVLGTATLNNGSASFLTTGLAVGSHSVTATYGGNTIFAASTSSADKQVVSKATTTTAVVSSQNPSSYEQSVTFTATVSPQFSGSTPTGTVTFKNGTVTMGSASLVNGVASYTTTKLAVGTAPVTVVYGGSPSFLTSTSTSLGQVVGADTTTTMLVSSVNPSAPGQSVTITATVAAQLGGTVSGSVTFMDGTTELSTVSLAKGAAAFTTKKLAAGTHNITATYNGATDFQTSAGALVQTVN